MKKTYKYRLFTNRSQERELAVCLETHRRLYNQALEAKRHIWETLNVSWPYGEQSAWFKKARLSNKWYARLNFWSAQNTLRTLDKAYVSFFKNGGYPRFKSGDRFNSFAFDMGGHGGGCKIIGRKIRLQNIGTIRVRWHRGIPEGGRLKQACIVRDKGKWYVCFSVDAPRGDRSPTGASIGLDVGLKAFVTTSEGECLGNSRILEPKIKELRAKQRALSRCRRGSKRRGKVKQSVSTLHAKVRNSRRDMHHKVARSLVDRYGVIAVESLNIKGMLRNHRLARRISDAGWSQFISILSSKAEEAGGQVIGVDARNTSQQCSKCGKMDRKSLSDRVHHCQCGLVLDRDINAARNILARAEPGIVNVGVA